MGCRGVNRQRRCESAEGVCRGCEGVKWLRGCEYEKKGSHHAGGVRVIGVLEIVAIELFVENTKRFFCAAGLQGCEEAGVVGLIDGDVPRVGLRCRGQKGCEA